MPNRVVWNLTYPLASADDEAIFRHHFETLRLDKNVQGVEATYDQHRRATRIHVEFVEGADRPDSVELRHADMRFPSTAHIEREIQVAPPTPEQATEILRQLRFEMPQITGISGQDAFARLREVALALRVPDFVGAANAIGAAIPGYRQPVTLPKWIAIGRVCKVKNERRIVTITRVRMQPESILVETVEDGKLERATPLAEFVNLYEPYERGTHMLTAWDRVLADDED
jgi:hypothetical protein